MSYFATGVAIEFMIQSYAVGAALVLPFVLHNLTKLEK